MFLLCIFPIQLCHLLHTDFPFPKYSHNSLDILGNYSHKNEKNITENKQQKLGFNHCVVRFLKILVYISRI